MASESIRASSDGLSSTAGLHHHLIRSGTRTQVSLIVESGEPREVHLSAVVGSAPAGLACAEQLNLVGYEVTVFERADRIGGLLMYSIPNMKLDKALVQRRVDVIAQAGVRFVTDTAVGIDISPAEMQAQFDAIVLCTGVIKPQDLPISGRELQSIHFAMDFLGSNTKEVLGDRRLQSPISIHFGRR